MPARPKVDYLPPEIRAELDRRLMANAFGGYVALSEWLENQGYTIKKSTLHYYGQQLERKVAKIKDTLLASKIIEEASPDDPDTRSAAMMSLVQGELFDTLIKLQEASEESDPAVRLKLLSQAANAVASIVRSSLAQKQWAMELRKKAEAAAEIVTDAAAKGGLSKKAIAMIRNEIMGIAA